MIVERTGGYIKKYPDNQGDLGGKTEIYVIFSHTSGSIIAHPQHGRSHPPIHKHGISRRGPERLFCVTRDWWVLCWRGG